MKVPHAYRHMPEMYYFKKLASLLVMLDIIDLACYTDSHSKASKRWSQYTAWYNK